MTKYCIKVRIVIITIKIVVEDFFEKYRTEYRIEYTVLLQKVPVQSPEVLF